VTGIYGASRLLIGLPLAGAIVLLVGGRLLDRIGHFVGCATVIADFAGLGGMVDTGNMQRLRRLNFGVRTMPASPITSDGVLAALRSYNPSDAGQVTEWIRSEADMSAAVDRLLAIYASAMEAPPTAGESDTHSLLADASAYLKGLAPAIKQRGDSEMHAQQADEALRIAESRSLEAARALAVAATGLADTRAQLARANGELQTIHRSRAWRAITRYRSLRAGLFPPRAPQ